MADSEIIGAVGVSITGDYSSLQAAFSDIQGKASQAGQDTAKAFNSGVAGVSDSADTAANAFQGMAEQLTAIGGALAITDGLVEFGKAALDASDAVTRADISLTKLTGDGQEAQRTLQGLEELGQADGLSMPSLLTAATRMTAMLPPGSDVVGLLGHIADGAAVMGTNVGQAATRFDQMADSGTTSARSLQSLGLSLPALATALNTVANTTVATASNVAAMFKAMDDQGRIAVLSEALSKLSGTAQEAANATFGGEWQQLANAWEAIMVQVGDALTPVLGDFLDFVKLDILPFVKDLATDFNELPGPVKDTAVAIGLVVAAAVPITGAVGAFALALGGLGTLATSTKGLLESMGISFGTVATQATAEGAAVGAAAAESVPAVEAVTAVTVESGEAAEASALQYDLFAHSVVASEWGAGAEQLGLFADAEKEVGIEATGMGADMSLAATGGVLVLAGAFGSLLGAYLAWKNGSEKQAQESKDLLDSVTQLDVALTKHGINVQALNDAYNNHEITIEQLRDKLQALETEWDNSVTKLQNNANNSMLLAGALKTLTENTDSQKQAYTNALAVYDAVVNSLTTQIPLYKNHIATTADLTNAEESLVSASGKIPEAIGSATIAIVQDQLAAEKAQLQYQAAAGAFQTLLQQFNAGAPIQAEVTTAFNKMQAASASAAAAGVPVAGSIQAIDAAAASSVNSMGNLVSSQQLETDKSVAQADKLTSLSAAVIVAGQKLDLLRQEQDNLGKSVTAGTAQQSQLNDVLTKAAAAAADLQSKTFALEDAQSKAGNAAADAGGQEGLLKKSLDDANLSLDQAKVKFDSGTITVGAYEGAIKAVTTAEVNLAVQVAEDNADIGRSTDATSLAAVAAAGAAAKLDILTQAFKDNKASASDVASAQTSALNAAIKFAEQQAAVATGVSDSTDAMNLQIVAVAEAKAKYDALVAAQQAGQPVWDQVAAASQDLKTKQDALNASVKDGNPLVIALAQSDSQTLVPALYSTVTAANAAAGAITQVGSAAAAAGGQITGIADDIKNLEAAFGSMGSSSTASSSGTGVAGGGYAAYNVVASANALENWVGEHVQGFNSQTAFSAMSAAQQKAIVAPFVADGWSDTVIAQMFGTTTSVIDPIISSITGGSTASSTPSASSAGSSAPGFQSPIIVGPQIGTIAAGTTTKTTDAFGQPISSDPGVESLIQSAEQALTTAEQSGNAAAIAVAQANLLAAEAMTSASGTSSTSPASTSTSQGVDGGVYPDVTAHQAVGEIWTVQIAGSGVSGASVAAAGGVSQQVSSTVNETVTGGSGATAALQGASEAIGGLVETLGQVAESVASVAQAVASKAVAGTPYTLPGAGGANTSTGLPGVVGGSGTAYQGAAPVEDNSVKQTSNAGSFTTAPPGTTDFLLQLQANGGVSALQTQAAQALEGGNQSLAAQLLTEISELQNAIASGAIKPTQQAGSPVFNPLTGEWLSGPDQPVIGPQLPSVPGPAGSYAPNGQPLTANVSININGAGMNNQQLATAILPAVIQGVVQATRAAGARY